MQNFAILAAVAALAASAPHSHAVAYAPDARARAVLDTGAARMGGIDALRSVQRARLETMTEWQRTALDDRPHPAVSSYEWSSEMRDYVNPAWRYTRRFLSSAGWTEIVDLVVDSVAAIKNNGKWAPQNIAYVDERTEAFTFTPERLMLLAWDAPDAKALTDTLINAVHYARVRATVNGFPTTLLFGKRDGALAIAQFRAAQGKDFGLAPWGEMEVSIAYSRWQRMAGVPLNLPTQLDIYRIGKPYKRITVLGALLNAKLNPDSVSMPDSLRTAFLALGGRAMFDLPVDTARIVDNHFAVFGTPGTPAGAIKIGGRWLFIEAGSAPISVERSAAFLTKADAGTPIGGALASSPSGQGGLVWIAKQKLQSWVTPGAKPYTDATLQGWKVATRPTLAPSGSWIRVGTDSLRIESIDLPDYPAAAVIYAPSLHWVYCSSASTPMVAERIASFAKQRGWIVDHMASGRDIVGAPLAH